MAEMGRHIFIYSTISPIYCFWYMHKNLWCLSFPLQLAIIQKCQSAPFFWSGNRNSEDRKKLSHPAHETCSNHKTAFWEILIVLFFSFFWKKGVQDMVEVNDYVEEDKRSLFGIQSQSPLSHVSFIVFVQKRQTQRLSLIHSCFQVKST